MRRSAKTGGQQLYQILMSYTLKRDCESSNQRLISRIQNVLEVCFSSIQFIKQEEGHLDKVRRYPTKLSSNNHKFFPQRYKHLEEFTRREYWLFDKVKSLE